MTTYAAPTLERIGDVASMTQVLRVKVGLSPDGLLGAELVDLRVTGPTSSGSLLNVQLSLL